ncbi:MAG TPA: hypothetical protein VI636_14315 [Candidatus Angelobacter sp.]
MLLLVSVVAMILSAALLITPANASITSHCTDCTKLVAPTVVEVAACKPTGVDGCYCPLPPPLLSNNCFFIGGDKPQQ